MSMTELLPGVTEADCPPRVACDAHEAIRRARRRALAFHAGQLALLAGVDWLFFRWMNARVPFLGRHESLVLLRAINVAALADLWLLRALPRWTARRIAATWSRSEREKFLKQSAAS